MGVSGEALDIILRIQNLRAFEAGMNEAAASTRRVGAAAKESSAATSASMNKSAGLMGMVQKASKATVFGLAAIGFEAYKMTVNFDKQMNQISVVTGESQKQLKGLRQGLLDMAGPVGFGPEKLAEAMAHIAKIDLPGVDRLKLLRAAADGASVGLADVVETTDTLAGAIKVHMPGMSNDVRTAMGQLIAAAQTGNMSLTDFNSAMGTGILPVAKEYGLTLTDITGALSIFTDEHMQGSSAMSQLATALHFLTGATAKGEKGLKKIGLSGLQLAQDMRGPRGLQSALQDLQDHLNSFSPDPNKQTMIMNSILPGGRGRILRVLMNQLDNYGQKMDQQAKATNNFDANVAKTHATAAWRLKAAWSALQSELIQIADTYKGPLTSVLVSIIGLMTGLASLLTHHKTLAHALLYAILGLAAAWVTYKVAVIAAAVAQGIWDAAMTAAAFIELATEVTSLAEAWALLTIAMDSNPVVLIALAIIGLIAAVIILYHKWKWFHDAVNDTFTFVKKHWYLLPFAAPIYLLWKVAKKVFPWIKRQIDDIVHAPGDFARNVINTIPGAGLINSAAGAIGLPHINMHPTTSKITARKIPSIFGAKSTVAATAGSSGIPDQHHHIQVVLPNGRVLAETVNKANADRKARK